jgi:hypothetical protein
MFLLRKIRLAEPQRGSIAGLVNVRTTMGKPMPDIAHANSATKTESTKAPAVIKRFDPDRCAADHHRARARFDRPECSRITAGPGRRFNRDPCE